jgi:hypothetical protein
MPQFETQYVPLNGITLGQANLMGKGQNYENHNVENQKEHRKIWR